MYSHGKSERILENSLEGRREESVIATKVGYQMCDEPNAGGLSRKAIQRNSTPAWTASG